MNLKVTTYNCKNIKSSFREVQELCEQNDIILLQETWLFEKDLAFLSGISTDHYALGISSINCSHSIITGRPHGGLAILWRKSLSHCCQVSTIKGENRLMELSLNLGDKTYYFINVYMPYCSSENFDEFMYYLHKCIDLIDASGHAHAMIIGDINADVTRDQNGYIAHLFGRELAQFCSNNNLTLADVEHLGNGSDNFSFFSNSFNSSSWIDHVICTTSMANCISDVHIQYEYITSDHKPVGVALIDLLQDTQPTSTSSRSRSFNRPSIRWSNLTTAEKEKYKELTNVNLSHISLNHELFLCDDTHCSNPSHTAAINDLYNSILNALLVSGESLRKLLKQFTVRFQGGMRCFVSII